MADPVPSERLIGYRMTADKSFASRVQESSFSSAEWDLIMSVVDFEIVAASDPDEAQLQPVLDRIDDAIAATAELPPVDQFGQPTQSTPSDGLLDRLLGLLRSTDDRDDERRHEAEALVSEYAAFLEGLLREDDAWADLCVAVVDDSSHPS